MYIKSLLGMVLGVCFSAGAETINLQVPPQEMLRLVQSGSANFELPEIEVFNSRGRSIFYQKSLPKAFRKELEAAIKSNVEGNRTISQSLEGLTDQSRQPFSLDGRKFDLAIIEYWADWCVSCKEQQKIVEAYIKENKSMDVLWLKVEKDPTKIEGVEVKKL